MNPTPTLHTSTMSASSFLESHKTLGTLYEPIMGGFLLISLLSPVWLTYIIYLSILSLINHLITQGTLLEYKPRIKSFCTTISTPYNNLHTFLRISADGLLNPCFLVIYPLVLTYLFGNTDTINAFVYTNKLGQTSYYSIPYFITALVAYWLWTFGLHTLLHSQKPSYSLHSNLLTRFFSPSRILGSAVVYLVVFDFNNSIDYLLWTNVYAGTGLACVSLLVRLIRIHKLPDVPKYRQ